MGRPDRFGPHCNPLARKGTSLATIPIPHPHPPHSPAGGGRSVRGSPFEDAAIPPRGGPVDSLSAQEAVRLRVGHYAAYVPLLTYDTAIYVVQIMISRNLTERPILGLNGLPRGTF